MKDAFQFVLVGTGSIASTYVDAIARMEGVEIVGIVSRKKEIPPGISLDREAVEVADRLSSLTIPFDAAILATPNGLHREGALEAARLGKHLLIEKVLDISTDACDRIIAACHAARVKLAVSYQRRTSPINRRMKKAIGQGRLGRIFAVDIEAKFFRDEAYYASAAYRGSREIDGGGPFIQQAAHDLDLLTWFFGLPERVASVCGTFLHAIESEDHGAAILKFQDGMIGTIIASTCCNPGTPSRRSIYSDLGRVILSGDEIVSFEIKGFERDEFDAIPVEPLAAGHGGILFDFVRAVRENRTPLVSGEEARQSVELVRKIYQSSL